MHDLSYMHIFGQRVEVPGAVIIDGTYSVNHMFLNTNYQNSKQIYPSKSICPYVYLLALFYASSYFSFVNSSTFENLYMTSFEWKITLLITAEQKVIFENFEIFTFCLIAII